MSIFGKLFGKKLTQAERWAIATGANVAATQGDTFSQLAMDFPRDVARQSLRDWWAVDGKVEVEERVVRLALEGHNAEFRELHRRVSRMDREEVEAWARELPDEEVARQARFVHEHRHAFKNGEILGWDLARVVNVSRAAYTAGWMKEDRAWEHIFTAARRIQSIYGSWRELSDNYLYARRWWGGEDEAEQAVADTARRLLNDPDSPWHDLPWQTPLS